MPEISTTNEVGGRGRVYAVVSLTSGAGVTTVAESLAAVLNASHGGRIAIVDMDWQNLGMTRRLELDAMRSQVGMPQARHRPEMTALEPSLTRHPSGVYLWTPPRFSGDSLPITPATLDAALDMMPRSFDYTVADCGPHLDHNTIVALKHTDEILYVIDQSLVAARVAGRFKQMLGAGQRPFRPWLIVNKFDPRRQISLEKISQLAPWPPSLTIPIDRAVAEPQRFPIQKLRRFALSSKFTLAIETLARQLTQRNKWHAPSPRVPTGPSRTPTAPRI